MFGIGAGEFVIILIVALIVFGPGQLPELGRSLGKALRAFRKAQSELSATLDEPAKPSPHPSDATTKTPPTDSQITVDDVINTAKQSPITQKQDTNSTP